MAKSSFVSGALCAVIGHKIDRKRVWHDTIDFRTQCARCGGAMIREDMHWRRFHPEQDANPHRSDAKQAALGSTVSEAV